MNVLNMDLKKIQEQARTHTNRGAVTPDYRADRQKVLELLDQALATELICVLRYRRHYETAQGLGAGAVRDEFLEHSIEEQEHADLLAKRIGQLGGEPDYNPDTLTKRSHTGYGESTDLMKMIEEDLVAERIAIQTYSELVRYLGDDDSTTRRMIEEILADEEEHADDLVKMLAKMSTGETSWKLFKQTFV